MPGKLLRRLTAIAAALLVLVLVGGSGLYLRSTQTEARDSVLRVFDQRARLAAGLTGDTLLSSDAKTREFAAGIAAGPASAVSSGLGTSLDPSTPWMVVFQHDGALIAAAPPSARSSAAAVRADPGFLRAQQTGTLTFGDLVTEGGTPTVRAFQPFPTATGTRVLVLPIAVENLAVALRSALTVDDARGFVVDSTGRILIATDGTPIGGRLPGRTGDDYAVDNPAAASSWRTVVIASHAALLGPLEGAAHSAWWIFAAFATAMLLLLIIGGTTLISLARLGHARLHDQLTGLPGRALFLSRTEAAIKRGPAATLFLDLDGFKPVNDTYGHAAGDDVLKQVAERLRASVRPGDYVSRFGGDEFLVLCPGVRDTGDAEALADRIRQRLIKPLEVAGRPVSIGVSIGLAVTASRTDHPEQLIQHADLALYRAKNNGRGRIESFA